MQIQIVERVTQHLLGRVGADPPAVKIAPADEQVQLGTTMDAIDACQADKPDRVRFAFYQNRTANVDAAPPQVLVEPLMVHFLGDVPRGSAEAVNEIAILPPAVDERDVFAGELPETHHRMTPLTT